MKSVLFTSLAVLGVASANLSGDDPSANLEGAAITAPPTANAGDAHARAAEISGPAYKFWKSRLHMPVIDKLEGHANNLLDRVGTLEDRADGYDVAWEDQAAINHGFEREIEGLEEQFDRVKSFRISSHHMHAFEEQDPKHLEFDVTLDIEPTHPVSLEIEGTETVTIDHVEYHWAHGEHSKVAAFKLTADLRGALRVETVKGVFKSEDPVFADQEFHIYVDVTPPCTISNGGCEHVCVEEFDGHHCLCNHGYRLDENEHNCNDIDECKEPEDSADINNCDLNSVCTNLIGSFSCDCNDGYRGDGHVHDGEPGCFDIDECEENIDECPKHSECINTDGFYECPCLPGFRHAEANNDHSACDDIDECAEDTDTCHDKATCTNVSPFYECDCNLGWRGDGEECHTYYSEVVADSTLSGAFTWSDNGNRNCLYIDFIRASLSKSPCSTLLNADMFMPGYTDAFTFFSFDGNKIQSSQAFPGMPLMCLTLTQDFFTGNTIAGAASCDAVTTTVEADTAHGHLTFVGADGARQSVSHASSAGSFGIWLGQPDGADANYSFLVLDKAELQAEVFGNVAATFGFTGLQ
eukprot:GFYU01000328.1.p2 GENE.GFYU01000328.1~~GFYU01000328.1.p2  ORF type:complete len:581 (+),score=198.48 GFYU01000328.1:66-1808(+)